MIDPPVRVAPLQPLYLRRMKPNIIDIPAIFFDIWLRRGQVLLKQCDAVAVIGAGGNAAKCSGLTDKVQLLG
ncbi:MAG: hypothetical protein OEU46_11415 [Alphaproteobacteria bacterium]|nr:hypothetical protein [Alphaproteobacteria bacterium]